MTITNRTSHRRRRLPAAALAALALASAPAAQAAPGTFTLHTCGTPETVTGPVAGWAQDNIAGPFSGATVATCTSSGAMTVGPGAHAYNYAVGDGAGLRYTAPANERVSRLKLDLHVSVTSRDGTGGEFGALGFIPRLAGASTGFMDWCKATNSCFGAVIGNGATSRDAVQEYTGLSDNWILLDIRCNDSNTCHGNSTEPIGASVNRAEIDLTESPAAAPESSSVQGSLTGDAVLSGAEGLSFSATDNASGVYRATIKVGDTELPVALDGTSPSCADARPGVGTAYEFTDGTPCPTSGSFSADVDTSKLPEGDQTLNVYVEDASGLRSKAFGPRAVKIDNVASADDPACRNGVDDDGDGKVDAADGGCAGSDDTSEAGSGSSSTTGSTTTSSVSSTSTSTSTTTNSSQSNGTAATDAGRPTNGTNASNRARILLSGTSRRTVGFGKSFRHTATLRDENGRPIAGATLTVLHRMSIPGAPWTIARAPIVTDADGRFSWQVPAKYGRTIRYAYKANLDNAEFQATSDLVVAVRSSTTLRLNKRYFHNGQTVRFSGRLRSKPVPGGGVLIDLQAKVGKKWMTFKTMRSKRDGRWSSKYRFHATSGLQTYAFRARVRQDTGYPYAISTSKTVKVKVRG
ncbi:MAG: hypothetical protein QOE86_4687 [Solirubrobacteraceae bacterium]|nr:hypothetical protein [Solirubrobacteraceae bacterium]